MPVDPNDPTPGNNNPPGPSNPPVDPQTPPERRCEGCGSLIDRRGRLLSRGARIKEFLAAEEQIDALRKELKAERDAHDTTKSTLAETRGKLSKYESRRFGALA